MTTLLAGNMQGKIEKSKKTVLEWQPPPPGPGKWRWRRKGQQQIGVG